MQNGNANRYCSATWQAAVDISNHATKSSAILQAQVAQKPNRIAKQASTQLLEDSIAWTVLHTVWATHIICSDAAKLHVYCSLESSMRGTFQDADEICNKTESEKHIWTR